MGWRDALQSITGAAAKKGFGSAASQDAGLPLRASIGSLLQLQKAPFIGAISSGSFIEMPTDSQNTIKAISRVNLPISGSVYRYYLSLVDADRKATFLQVYVDQQGEVGDIVYCSPLTRFTPETEEEQQLFMGLAGAGLGDKHYCLWREQLAELGYGEADLRAAFAAEEVIEYWRDAGDPECDFIQPFAGSETWLGRSWGAAPEFYYMPYRRELKRNGYLEYLFITTLVGPPQHGDSGLREMSVEFTIGIPVAADQVRVS